MATNHTSDFACVFLPKIDFTVSIYRFDGESSIFNAPRYVALLRSSRGGEFTGRVGRIVVGGRNSYEFPPKC